MSRDKGTILCNPVPNTPRVNLVVLRVADIDRSAQFYQLLGLTFSKHSHGAGPLHYASEVDGFAFELYPASPEQPASRSVRIGFAVADVGDAVAKLGAFPDAKVVSVPKDSEWGRRAVVADPDGHRVELTIVQRPLERMGAAHSALAQTLPTSLHAWQDWDLASYELAVGLGVLPGGQFLEFKHLFWTNSTDGQLLHDLLERMVDAGIFEARDEPDRQYRLKRQT